MQNTATIIAHILFRHGAVLNLSNVIRTLDLCLDRTSNGAYALAWDSEDVMIAEFAQTKVILVAGHQLVEHSDFALTVAVSPKDADAITNPRLFSIHKALIQELVTRFEQPLHSGGVLWQRANAPIDADEVEHIAEGIATTLSLVDATQAGFPTMARSFESSQFLPTPALTLQSQPPLPI